MATILVVDDQPTGRQFLVTLLGYQGYRLLEAGNGEEALEIVQAEAPDLVITDLVMPGMDGYEFAIQLRSDPKVARMPVIFYTAGYDAEEASDLARSCRVFHILSKPSDPEVILSYVAAALQSRVPPLPYDRSDEMGWAQKVQTQHHRLLVNKLHKTEHTRLQIEMQATQIRKQFDELTLQQSQLREANAWLARLASTDGLTGLKNRRTFQACLEQEFGRARRYEAALSLVLLDVDKFKEYNDTFGHPAGDAALKQIAALLEATVRQSDIAARYGGEEFAMILPNTGQEGALLMAERLRETIAAAPWPHRLLTVSVGVASLTLGAPGCAQLVQEADQALYAAKQAGRNRVMHCTEPGRDIQTSLLYAIVDYGNLIADSSEGIKNCEDPGRL